MFTQSFKSIGVTLFIICINAYGQSVASSPVTTAPSSTKPVYLKFDDRCRPIAIDNKKTPDGPFNQILLQPGTRSITCKISSDVLKIDDCQKTITFQAEPGHKYAVCLDYSRSKRTWDFNIVDTDISQPPNLPIKNRYTITCGTIF